MFNLNGNLFVFNREEREAITGEPTVTPVPLFGNVGHDSNVKLC